MHRSAGLGFFLAKLEIRISFLILALTYNPIHSGSHGQQWIGKMCLLRILPVESRDLQRVFFCPPQNKFRMKEKPKPSYYAIIPASVRYDPRLPAGAKLLYGEVTALSNQKGYCFASNGYFSDLYACTPQAISKWFQLLKLAGHVKISYSGEPGKSERRVSISVDTYQPQLRGVSMGVEGVSMGVEHINTSISLQEIEREEPILSPPTEEKGQEPIWVSCLAHLSEQLEGGEYSFLLQAARKSSRYSGPLEDVAKPYCRNIQEGLIAGKGDFHLRPPAKPGEHRKWISRMMAGIERYMSAAVRRENSTAPKITPPAPHAPDGNPIIRATAESARKIRQK